MLSQRPADALTAPRRIDDQAGVGDVCPRARVNGMGVRAPEKTQLSLVCRESSVRWFMV